LPELKKELKHSTELLTAKAGLLICDAFERYNGLPELIDSIFPKPGSNRGFPHSKHIMTLLQLFHDGAESLEDVRELASDKALQQMTDISGYPTADAIGNWLRRMGSSNGVQCLWGVMRRLLELLDGNNFTLDIDATIIESNKGDAQKTYKGIYGYQPMLGTIAEKEMVVGSEFRTGNSSPSSGLVKFISMCRENIDNRIKYVRSDSAAFQKNVVKYLVKEQLFYSITAQQNEAVIRTISQIPENHWQQGVDSEAIKTDYQIAETNYAFIGKRKASRLIVKREKKKQLDLYDQSEFRYWAIITNLPKESHNTNQVVLTHQMRGQMEKTIGEIKHHGGLDHLPCGQFEANAMYFTVGILAYNLLQLLKQDTFFDDYVKSSIKTFRYKLIHLPARVVKHGRKMFIRIACSLEKFRLIQSAFLKYMLSPPPVLI
jgi:hypothetical protein